MLNEDGNQFKVKDDEQLEQKPNAKLNGKLSDPDKLANFKNNKKISFDKENGRKLSEKAITEEEEDQNPIKQEPPVKKEDAEQVEKRSSDKENATEKVNENKPALGRNSGKKKSSLNKSPVKKDASDEPSDEPSDEAKKKPNEPVKQQQAAKEQQSNLQAPAKPADDPLNSSSQAMECSPARKRSPAKIDPNLVTPKNNKQLPSKLDDDDDEWLTDDESSLKMPPDQLNNAIGNQAQSANSKPKSCLPGPRAALKRSATVKSATKPVVEIKRNKTNEFATPQSIKKLSRPLYGSASKKLLRPPTATVTKSAVAKPNVNLPKVASHANYLEVPSQTASASRILPPSTSASSSLSSSSQLSLKSCPSTSQQTGKTLSRNNSNNSNNSENKQQQRCFAESALKKRLEEEKRRKQLELNIQAKEDDAKTKRNQFLLQRALETKSKREERERKVQEGKLLHNAEVESKRVIDLKKQEELKKEEQRKLDEIRRQAELKRKQEEEEHAKKLAEQKRAEELAAEELKKKQTAKKVEFVADCNEDLQTKLYEKLEKKLIEDQMKCKNTPIKQLVREAVGKTNAEKSLYKPEVDPSLDVIDLSLSTDDSSFDDEETIIVDVETTTNCTFIKDINNKALSSTLINKEALSTTFNKPTAHSSTFTKPTAPASGVPSVENAAGSSQPQAGSAENSVISTYDISDLRSDDEDEDEVEDRPGKKKIPSWAKGPDFLKSIQKQYSLHSREREDFIKDMFSSIDSNVPLERIFRESQKHVSKKYARRTSSACWSSPPMTYIDKSFSTFY